MQYASIVPGKLNISRWFRPVMCEFNLWNKGRELVLKEGEPLAYINFQTNESVELVRFSMTDRLKAYALGGADAPKWEPFVPLAKRYKRFMQTRTNRLVLNEIQKNLVN